MPAMAAGAPRPGAPGAAPVQGAPFAQPGALPRPAMPPGAPVGAPRPPTPGQPTSMPQRPHVPGQPGTGSLPRSQTPHQLPYASQPGESGPLPQVGAPGMQPGMVPRSGTPYGTHTGMPPPMPQGAPMTAPAAQPPRPGMVSQPTGTYGQAPMMAQAPTMPGQPPMPNMGAAPNAGQPQFQPALVSTPTPPSPTGLGMAPAAHHKPRRAYAAQAYSAAAAAPDQLTAQGMLPGTSAPGPMAYGQAPNGTGLSGPSQLQQPAQPQFFTPGDPMAGAIPGVPGVASTYGQPGVAPGAMLQQPQGAAGGVAALTQGMAALGLAVGVDLVLYLLYFLFNVYLCSSAKASSINLAF